MRLRVCVATLLYLVLATTLVFATTISLTPIPGRQIDGTFADFGIYGGSININNTTGWIDISLQFNYPAQNLQTIVTGQFGGLTIKPADLLFVTGGKDFGIVLGGPLNPASVAHDSLNTGLAAGMVGFYSGTGFIDAQTALNIKGTDKVNLISRPTSWVWIDGAVSLGTLKEDVVAGGPSFNLRIYGFLPQDFLTLVNTNGVDVDWASADCANDYVTGHGDPRPPVPEPASLVLFATGLLATGGVLRHRILNK